MRHKFYLFYYVQLQTKIRRRGRFLHGLSLVHLVRVKVFWYAKSNRFVMEKIFIFRPLSLMGLHYVNFSCFFAENYNHKVRIWFLFPFFETKQNFWYINLNKINRPRLKSQNMGHDHFFLICLLSKGITIYGTFHRENYSITIGEKKRSVL